ncbi:MAG: hypothetical protein ACM3S5_18500 [Rhodospirillales bacterium]
MRWPAEWRDPALLELLKGTPINCLVTAGEGAPAPAVLEKAKQDGLTFVEPGKSPGIAWTERANAPWGGSESVLAITDGVWPGVQRLSREEAGPTGAPWIDSNGWMIQLSRALAENKDIWIAVNPPEKSANLRAAVYQLAVVDAEAYGARWVISLDKQWCDGLAKKSPAAMDGWKAIAATLRFFDAHRDWAAYRPLGALGVVSDFHGPNEYLAGEVLNLSSRRSLPYRILIKSRALAASLEGLKAIVYPDEQAPDAALMKKLLAFANEGGLLMVPANFPAPKGVPLGGDVYGRYELRGVGKGRIAVAKEESQDPYLIAADAQLLMSHQNDLVRFFNTGTLNCYYTASADGKKSLLHIINFAMRPSNNLVSAAFTRRFRAARFWRLEDESAQPLELFPTEDGGMEVHIPAFSVYAAIELDS